MALAPSFRVCATLTRYLASMIDPLQFEFLVSSPEKPALIVDQPWPDSPSGRANQGSKQL